jgi:hypothetical protein
MKLFYLSFISFFFVFTSIFGQTPGELSVSVSTSETGGNYAPRNIVAIWIEDNAGNFQKTLLAYAQTRKTHLNTWQASTANAGTEYNTTDAITGATRSSHSTRECTWDGTDFNGNLLADGEYSLWMELTDKNGTGNFSSFQFTKNDEMSLLMPSDAPSFSSIVISWVPSDPTSVFEIGNQKEVSIYPNPGNGIYTIDADEPVEIEVLNSSGKLVQKTNAKTIDIGNQPSGVYFIFIKTSSGVVTNKVIKN